MRGRDNHRAKVDTIGRHFCLFCGIAFRRRGGSVPNMVQDRPLLGIFLMLGFCVFTPMGDAAAKLLGQSMPVGQLLFVRFAVQAVLLVPLLWLTGRSWWMQRRIFWLTLFRTVLHILGIGAMYTALQYLPLADAVAIAFVMPFIILLLGKYILNEEVGRRRLIACTVGFIGTLMVVQPSFAKVGSPALLPLLVAVIYSFFMLQRMIQSHLFHTEAARRRQGRTSAAKNGESSDPMTRFYGTVMPSSIPEATEWSDFLYCLPPSSSRGAR